MITNAPTLLARDIWADICCDLSVEDHARLEGVSRAFQGIAQYGWEIRAKRAGYEGPEAKHWVIQHTLWFAAQEWLNGPIKGLVKEFLSPFKPSVVLEDRDECSFRLTAWPVYLRNPHGQSMHDAEIRDRRCLGMVVIVEHPLFSNAVLQGSGIVISSYRDAPQDFPLAGLLLPQDDQIEVAMKRGPFKPSTAAVVPLAHEMTDISTWLRTRCQYVSITAALCPVWEC